MHGRGWPKSEGIMLKTLLLSVGDRTLNSILHGNSHRPPSLSRGVFLYLRRQSLNEIHRKYHAVADLFPLMQGNEYDSLKADIAANGLREPICLHPNGSILDGRNRHRACIETETPPRFRTWDSKGSLVGFVVSMNLRRRHLNETQRAMIAAKIANMPLGANQYTMGAHICAPITQPEAAKTMNIGVRNVQHAKQILEHGTPELREAVEQGKIGVVPAAKAATELSEEKQNEFTNLAVSGMTGTQARRELVKRQREEQWRKIESTPHALDENNWPKSITLYTGDFAQVAQALEPESISLIVTDPPYGADNTHLYELLAREAARLLRPGGSLLAMAGQLTLPAIYNLMQPYLAYHWTIAYLTLGGQSPQIWPRKVNTFWKPVLWFTKGEYTGDWQGDVVKSDNNDKRFHGWGQSESGIGRLVSKFPSPGIVLDPFVGGGTVGIVCHRLRRPFIGIDVDAEAIETTRRRILTEVVSARS